MERFWIGLLKLVLASFILGTVLSFVGITPVRIIGFFGFTPESFQESFDRAVAWVAPRTTLGAMIIVPVWLFTVLFLPNRNN